MKIAVVGHVRFPIAPPFAGGMEAHTHGLVKALLARGHEVRLFAAGDSDPALPVEPIVAEHYEKTTPWATSHGTPVFDAMQRDIFARCGRKLDAFDPDIVHNNSLSPDVIDDGMRSGRPMLTSLHVPPFAALSRAVRQARGEAGMLFTTVSETQLESWSPDRHPSIRAVPNGIDTGHWRPRGAVGSHAIWAGRITPTKGTAHAVRAATLAGIRLRIFGPIEDEGYFIREVAPYLDDRIAYEGPLGSDGLAEQMSCAAVALVTPCWDEPFGLVAAEALASGTPIAGFARGAIPEVAGDCGVLVEEGDVAGLAKAIAAARQIDRLDCRHRGLLFSEERMVDAYERLYAEAIAERASSSSRTLAELA